MKPALDVLHVDNHVIAVAKPAGVPTAPDASGDPSLLDLAREWVRIEFEKPGAAFLGLVHRLDRPVSGVVVFARTSKGAARLSAQFRERATRKVYWGVVAGRPAQREGLVEQWLVKDERANRVRAAPSGSAGAKQARTRWRVLAEGATRTLVELVPETGRAHQLRAACATLGLPLLGDLKYGATEPLPDASIALHARRLEIAHPTSGERLVLEAAPPRLAAWAIAR